MLCSTLARAARLAALFYAPAPSVSALGARLLPPRSLLHSASIAVSASFSALSLASQIHALLHFRPAATPRSPPRPAWLAAATRLARRASSRPAATRCDSLRLAPTRRGPSQPAATRCSPLQPAATRREKGGSRKAWHVILQGLQRNQSCVSFGHGFETVSGQKLVDFWAIFWQNFGLQKEDRIQGQDADPAILE